MHADVKKAIEEFVKKAELKRALELLETVPEFRLIAIKLISRLSALERLRAEGRISPDNFEVKQNELTHDLLFFINSEDARQSPLMLSIINGRFGVINTLLDDKAYINWAEPEQHLTALHIASRMGDTTIVELLIKKGANVNSVTISNSTPLHLAAIFNHIDVIRILISAGADLDAADSNGFTALQIAIVQKGRLLWDENMNAAKLSSLHKSKSIVELLIHHNASLSVSDNDGNSPLHYAVIYADIESAKLLLSKGDKSLPNIRNKNNRTPLQTAMFYHGQKGINGMGNRYAAVVHLLDPRKIVNDKAHIITANSNDQRK